MGGLGRPVRARRAETGQREIDQPPSDRLRGDFGRPLQKRILSPRKKQDDKPAAELPADFPAFVVETQPKLGDMDVDAAAVKEIRVTFSKPMTDKSWSWTQGNVYSFPESTGAIHYLADKRTCVMPVKLEPGKTYVMGINGGRFNNFKDAAGNAVAGLHDRRSGRGPRSSRLARAQGRRSGMGRADADAGRLAHRPTLRFVMEPSTSSRSRSRSFFDDRRSRVEPPLVEPVRPAQHELIPARGDRGGPDHRGHAPGRRLVLGLDLRRGERTGSSGDVSRSERPTARADRDGLDRLGRLAPRGRDAADRFGRLGRHRVDSRTGRNGSMKSVGGQLGLDQHPGRRPRAGLLRQGIGALSDRDSNPWPSTGGGIGCSSSVAVARIACVVTGIVLGAQVGDERLRQRRPR